MTPRGQEDPDATRCAWETHGARCRMRASFYPHGTTAGDQRRLDGFCAWHHVALGRHQGGSLEDFGAWQERLRAGKICGLWTHHVARDLWHLVNGEAVRLDAPTPCGRALCWAEDTLATRGAVIGQAARERVGDAA